MQIRLEGEIAATYDVYYRVHVKNIGWVAWTKDNGYAGSVGKNLRIEGLQIELVKKGETVKDPLNVRSATNTAFSYDALSYYAHVQNIGDQSWVTDGKTAGTTGKNLRVEGLAFKLADLGASSNVNYSTHVQNIGWTKTVRNGTYSGTRKRALRVEAIKLSLSGAIAADYHIYYRVHVQNFGWMAWTSDGKTAGTEGLGLRVEAVQAKLVKNGATAPSTSGHASVKKTELKQKLHVYYKSHVQNIGWQKEVKDGALSGTTGQSKRIEAYQVRVQDDFANDAYISYHAHIQNIGNTQGWIDSRNTKAYSGTTGQNKCVEAIRLTLHGYASHAMDVWYRVYTQDYGWLGWAKNGDWPGTSNGSKRVEAIEIVLRAKSEGAPGSTSRHYMNITSYPQANAVLNRVGRNLRAAYNWSAGLKYWRQSYSPNKGTRWYANIGFKQNRGNCYAMAATFTEMARALGYKCASGCELCTTPGRRRRATFLGRDR